MDFAQLAEYANHGLTWVGFGTIVGLAAKAVMPDRDPGGPIALLMMSITGSLIGCALLRYFFPAQPIEPVSLMGFAFGSGGAFALLVLYRVLGRHMAHEMDSVRHRRQRRRQRFYEVYEE